MLDNFGTEIRLLLRTLFRLIPLFVLLFVVFLGYHFVGIAYSLWCFFLALKTNRSLKVQVALKQNADTVMLTHMFFILLTHVLGTLVIFGDLAMLRFRVFLFLPLLFFLLIGQLGFQESVLPSANGRGRKGDGLLGVCLDCLLQRFHCVLPGDDGKSTALALRGPEVLKQENGELSLAD